MKAMDANRYATKKTIAQGMLDIALLTANASQLKYILQVGEQHQFYKLMLILISLSIVMQILSGVLSLSLSLLRDCRLHQPEFHQSANVINHLLVGILFVAIGSLNINKQQDQTAAIILNDIILVVIFVISVMNVIISGFGIEYSSQPLRLIDQHAKVLTGVILVAQTLVSIEKSRNREILFVINHFADAFIFLSVFCDVVKMNFGLDPAIPHKEGDVEFFKP
ncbi:GH21383 [Drosophila grimshawi]|uniref:GH21383 n=1 Tax=Drosophila grimshawi TaxID=7222 RepID=B4JRT2_DROGR|nr:GH21383 [Drosophila grimshawi]